MSIESFYLLRSYYLADPVAFMNILNGDSTTAQIYKALIAQFVKDISNQTNNSSSKIIRLDLDGNIMYSNNEPYFGQTKEDVKTVCSHVQKVTDFEYLVGDGWGKRAFILKANISNFTGIIESLFADTPTDEDIQFINAVFGNIETISSYSQIVWNYNSERYICSFSLVPNEIQEVSICDDAIRNSEIWVRQGTTVKFMNNSSRPISIYDGKTDYDQFNLNPDLSLYGHYFKSSVLQPGESYSYKFVSYDEWNYFTYPDILTGKINVTRNVLNANDTFLIIENDNLGQPLSSRVIKVNSWGDVLASFGECYIVNPRKAQPLLSGNMLIST